MESKGKVLNSLEKTIDWLKKNWGIIVSLTISISIISLFTASFCNKSRIELQDMNNWVSIILGLIATILGIISLVLSFYNLEKTNESNEKNLQVLNEVQMNIDKKLANIKTEQKKLANQFSNMESKLKGSETIVTVKDSKWENE